MNDEAQLIILQLTARKSLLQSMETSGKFVMQDTTTKLCMGTVQGSPALVPVEYATCYSAKDIQAARARHVDWLEFTSMAEVVADDLLRLDTEMAWVSECGGAR